MMTARDTLVAESLVAYLNWGKQVHEVCERTKTTGLTLRAVWEMSPPTPHRRMNFMAFDVMFAGMVAEHLSDVPEDEREQLGLAAFRDAMIRLSDAERPAPNPTEGAARPMWIAAQNWAYPFRQAIINPPGLR
jgi:hypothetical protein